MQFLSFVPCPTVAVFPEVFDHQPYIIEVPDTGLGMPEPKTLRVLPHQCPRVLDQLRRRGRRGGKIMQGFRPVIHGATLRRLRGDRNNGVRWVFWTVSLGRCRIGSLDDVAEALAIVEGERVP